MKIGVLTGAAALLCVGAVVFALHFELSARSDAYHELRQLRGRTVSDLGARRITRAKATAVDQSLHEARIELEEDDVRGAQKLIEGAKAELATHTRAA